MKITQSAAKTLLPKEWPRHVQSAMLHAMSLAQHVLTHARGWAANSLNARVRLQTEAKRAHSESALLREEMRIKDQRMAALSPHRRPYYAPAERMAILELRAARGWSLAETARRFLVDDETISSWTRRLDEPGEKALLAMPEPVNRFPEMVGCLTRRLKTLCPVLGKKRIAQLLAREGLHLSVTTAGRMLKREEPSPRKQDGPTNGSTNAAASAERKMDQPHGVVTARHPDHLWQIDLTVAPTILGFWVPWFPFTRLQVWPFCWWVVVVLDHFSRGVVKLAVFRQQPDSAKIQALLSSLIRKRGKAPRHLVCDKGVQFWCDAFKGWCKRRGIRPRFGAIGRYGSIAVTERFIQSLKTECTRVIQVSLRDQDMQRQLEQYAQWFNAHRPHQGISGRTPLEKTGTSPIQRLRLEPRPRWPIPHSAKGAPSAIRAPALQLVVTHMDGEQHLPIVELKLAA
ncbi:MAG: transposase [Verrucomicrobia bacterium]|nr:transposase [Verrucomicrobiota bacterium]